MILAKKRNVGYLLIISASALVSGAHILFKLCTQWDRAISAAAGGTVLLIGSGVLAAKAYQQGKLSVLYPLLFFSQIWNLLLARFVLEEPVHLLNWMGVLLIVAGAAVVVR